MSPAVISTFKSFPNSAVLIHALPSGRHDRGSRSFRFFPDGVLTSAGAGVQTIDRDSRYWRNYQLDVPTLVIPPVLYERVGRTAKALAHKS